MRAVRHIPSCTGSHGPLLGRVVPASTAGSCTPRPPPIGTLLRLTRYKAKEIEAMRSKVPLVQLQAMVKSMKPARDFKGAIAAKAAATGAAPQQPPSWAIPAVGRCS